MWRVEEGEEKVKVGPETPLIVVVAEPEPHTPIPNVPLAFVVKHNPALAREGICTEEDDITGLINGEGELYIHGESEGDVCAETRRTLAKSVIVGIRIL